MLFVTIAAVMALAAAEPQATTDAPSTTEATAATPGPPKPTAKDDSKKVVCEETADIGSIIPRRVCRTRAEWDRRAHHDQEELRKLREQGGSVNE